VQAFIDLAEAERRARGLHNARFVCADSKPAGIPSPDGSFDLLLSRRGPRNWIADARRVGRPGAVMLMLCPISGSASEWNDERAARELYRFRTWGRDPALVPSYECCAAALERVFARHAQSGRLRVAHRRWIWRAVGQ
jgi:SAM-dependent methyltransferase